MRHYCVRCSALTECCLGENFHLILVIITAGFVSVTRARHPAPVLNFVQIEPRVAPAPITSVSLHAEPTACPIVFAEMIAHLRRQRESVIMIHKPDCMQYHTGGSTTKLSGKQNVRESVGHTRTFSTKYILSKIFKCFERSASQHLLLRSMSMIHLR